MSQTQQSRDTPAHCWCFECVRRRATWHHAPPALDATTSTIIPPTGIPPEMRAATQAIIDDLTDWLRRQP